LPISEEPAWSGYSLNIIAWPQANKWEFLTSEIGNGPTPYVGLSIIYEVKIMNIDVDDMAEYMADGPKWDHHVISLDMTRLSQEMQENVFLAIFIWHQSTGLGFTFRESNADITFYNSINNRTETVSSSRDGILEYSQIYLSVFNSSPGTFGFFALLHEIGHALGLQHPGLYKNNSNFLHEALFIEDSYHTSVMSYFDQDENIFELASKAFPITPMLADILAIRSKYGYAPDSFPSLADKQIGINPNTLYDPHPLFQISKPYDGTSPITMTIRDTSGIDKFDFRTDIHDQYIDLRAPSVSSVYGSKNNVIITDDTIIENVLSGKGNDVIIGNWVDNDLAGNRGEDKIFGEEGDDVLKGWAGDDFLHGGEGDDTLIGGKGHDVMRGGEGADTFMFRISHGNFDDLILDFNSYEGDKIDLHEFELIKSISDLDIHKSGRDTIIDLGDNGIITLIDYEDNLTNDDFIFVT